MSIPDSTPNIQRKQCTRCKEWKPATSEYFCRDKNRPDGFFPHCKACKKAYNRANQEAIREYKHQYRELNHDNILEYERQYREANREARRVQCRRWREVNPEHRRKYREVTRESRLEYNRQYYAKNREEKLEYHRQYRKANREIIRERQRRWKNRNPGKVQVTRHIRRTRKRNLPNDFTTEDWQCALDYFDNRCAVCGRPPGLWHTLAADHWIALSDDCEDNPGTVPWNIIPLCHSTAGVPAGEPACNNSKTNRLAGVFLRERYSEREARDIEQRIADYFAWVREQKEGENTRCKA